MAEYVMAALVYEDKAEVELVNSCTDIVIQFLDGPFEHEAAELANMLNELGEYIFQELREMQAYTNGCLFYQFRGYCGYDLMLGHFDPITVPIHH
jgi:flagellin-specific chaperone FliS